MQLKTKPIVLSLIVIFGLTIAVFLLTSYFRYTSTFAVAAYIKSRPAQVAIVCADPANLQNGYFHNADQAFPLAGVFKLIHLAAYSDEVAAGRLDPNERVQLSELEKYYLPGTDGGAHPEFIKTLGENRDSLTLDEIAAGMTSYGSNAAQDYLASRLANVDYTALYQHLGLLNTSLPGSFLGLYLFIKNHETGMWAEEDLTDREVRTEQNRLSNLFVNDPAWRQAEVNFISKPTNAAPINVQEQVINQYGMLGSANDMSHILQAAYGYNDVLAPASQAIMQKHLEWIKQLNPEAAKPFNILASTSGAWPGVLTSAWYARPPNARPTTLVVLYRNMPDDFWNTWITTFSHQQFETQVLLTADCSLLSQ